jgi:two-component system, chemotaxis family, sensor kinase CheA
MNDIQNKLQGRRILIVDDDPRNTFALVSYLDGMEMKIHTAEDGFGAIEALERYDDIDLILMDMMMPAMDGFETIGRIRSNVSTAGIPIISLTAKAMKGDRARCLEAGATEYVSKPVNMKELLEKMEDMITR